MTPGKAFVDMGRSANRKYGSWRRVLVLGGLLVALAVPAAFVAGRRVMARRVEGWRREGFAAAGAGDHARAADALLPYVKRRPDDVEALRLYARSRESAELPDARHLAEAMEALRLLLAASPDNVDDR